MLIADRGRERRHGWVAASAIEFERSRKQLVADWNHYTFTFEYSNQDPLGIALVALRQGDEVCGQVDRHAGFKIRYTSTLECAHRPKLRNMPSIDNMVLDTSQQLMSKMCPSINS